MMRRRSLRIFSLFMAFFMLFASSGFSMDVHYCDGDMKRANIFGKAKTCAEVQACMIKCGKTATSCSSEKNGGCDNESFVIDFDFDAADVVYSVEISKAYFVHLPNTSLQITPKTEKSLYTSYIPPPLIEDRRVLFQTFLI